MADFTSEQFIQQFAKEVADQFKLTQNEYVDALAERIVKSLSGIVNLKPSASAPITQEQKTSTQRTEEPVKRETKQNILRLDGEVEMAIKKIPTIATQLSKQLEKLAASKTNVEKDSRKEGDFSFEKFFSKFPASFLTEFKSIRSIKELFKTTTNNNDLKDNKQSSFEIPKIFSELYKRLNKPLSLPKITLPTLQTPKAFQDLYERLSKPLPLALPKITLPKLTLPKITLPNLEIPKAFKELSDKLNKPLPLALPKITLPTLQTPKAFQDLYERLSKPLPLALPKITLPKLTLPKIALPTLQTPKAFTELSERLSKPLTLPKITLPTLQTPKAFQDLYERLSRPINIFKEKKETPNNDQEKDKKSFLSSFKQLFESRPKEKKEEAPKSFLEADTKRAQPVLITGFSEDGINQLTNAFPDIIKKGMKDVVKEIQDLKKDFAKSLKHLEGVVESSSTNSQSSGGGLVDSLIDRVLGGKGKKGKGLRLGTRVKALGRRASRLVRGGLSKVGSVFGVGRGVAAKAAEKVGEKAIEKAEAKAAEKVEASVAAKATEKAAEKAGASAVAKTAEKAVGKTVAKTAGKTLLKSGLKKIPILGAVAGLGFGAQRALAGDWLGATGEVASGIAGSIPGLGTAASVGIDAALAARDVYKATHPETPKPNTVVPPLTTTKLTDAEKKDQEVQTTKNENTETERANDNIKSSTPTPVTSTQEQTPQITPEQKQTPAIDSSDVSKSEDKSAEHLEKLVNHAEDQKQTLAYLANGFDRLSKVMEKFGMTVAENSGMPPTVVSQPAAPAPQANKFSSTDYAAVSDPSIPSFRSFIEQVRSQPA